MSLGLTGAGAAQDRQQPKPSLALVITAGISEIKLGSPVQLKLVLTNTSGHDVWLSMSNVNWPVFRNVALRKIDIQVRDGDGKPTAETEYGRTIHRRSVEKPAPSELDPSRPLRGGGLPHDVFTVLLPERTLTEESDLSKEFDLSKPGKYTVQATAAFADPDTGLGVHSNTVTFTIAP